MTAPWIDLNADLGEGCADDESLLAVVTSASIACGVHAGDAPTMAATVTPRLAADRAMPVVAEAFADRAYAPDGSLVPRSAPGALIEDPDLAAEQAVRIATEGRIVTADGSSLALEARSICVHGDAPGAAVRAHRVRRALEAAGVTVRRFAP